MIKIQQDAKGSKKGHLIIAYFLIYVVWGSTYFFIGTALKNFPPFLLGAFRFTIAGITVLFLCFLRGERIFGKTLLIQSLVSGIVLLFVDMAIVMVAQQYVSSSLVAIIASSTALWIIVFDFPMWKENFKNCWKVTGMVTGFLGVAVFYSGELTVDHTSSSVRKGILLLFFGCISWAVGTLYTKYYAAQNNRTISFAGSGWQMVFASLMFWLSSGITGEIINFEIGSVAAPSWIALGYLIVFGSVLTYSAYLWLLKVRPAAEVGTHAYVNPFIAVLLGISMGNEQVTVLQILGLIIIVSGIIVINKRELHSGK